jgi:cytoskeleton protein RodZ
MAGEAGPAADETRSAGALLREARQARGMHIAALAAAIKVSPRKLEALENDRYEELVDATFTRALAQTVCRALKIDAEPVLSRLPQTAEKGLHVSAGLNAPLRQRAVRRDNGERPAMSRPVVWGSLALLAAAAAVYFLPPSLLSEHFGRASAPAASAPQTLASAPAAAIPAPVPAPPASAAISSPAASGPAVAATPASAAPVPVPASAPAPAAAASGGNDLVVRALSGPTWLEVQDANGKVLVSRMVSEGESVSLAGPTPLRVKIGNAPATQVSFRGEPVPLARDKTLVRLELK